MSVGAHHRMILTTVVSVGRSSVVISREIEILLKDLSVRHAALASVVDDVQRALSVAGAPLRGEIR